MHTQLPPSEVGEGASECRVLTLQMLTVCTSSQLKTYADTRARLDTKHNIALKDLFSTDGFVLNVCIEHESYFRSLF